MQSKEDILKIVVDQKILPLYFYKDEEVSLQVLRTLYSAGIKTVEYTNRGDDAFRNFSSMKKLCSTELKDMVLGIGTVKTSSDAFRYIDAGADYIISPGLVEEVAEVANNKNMLWIPGCMTPSEIIRAENLGAKMIKLFPGNILGTEFLTAVKPVFPGLLFMPTGGVDLDKENIASWFKAGVSAVGMGSKLISKQLLENKDYSKLESLAKEAIKIVNSVG